MKRQNPTPITSFMSVKITSLECSRCLTRVIGNSKLEEHLLNCSKWVCKVCSKTFLSEDSFNKHLKTNCPPKRFPCAICGRMYSRQSDTHEHEKKCAGGKTSHCFQCNATFTTTLDGYVHKCSQKESTKISQTNQKCIATYVMFDLETTGLIENRTVLDTTSCNKSSEKKTVYPQITQLCLLAVSADSLANIADNNTPRVLNKLHLTVSPTKLVSPGAMNITGKYFICNGIYEYLLKCCILLHGMLIMHTLFVSGLDNAKLSTQKSFSKDTVQLIDSFLSQHPEPICLVAHNGMSFDFPVLKAELLRVGGHLSISVQCLDSLQLFKSMPHIFGLDETGATVSAAEGGTPKGPTKQTVCRQLQFDKTLDVPVQIKEGIQVSYSLSNIYRRLFKRPMQDAHSAEGDCIALMQILHRTYNKVSACINNFVKPF